MLGRFDSVLIGPGNGHPLSRGPGPVTLAYDVPIGVFITAAALFALGAARDDTAASESAITCSHCFS